MVIRVRIPLGTPVLPIYLVVEKVLDLADVVVMNYDCYNKNTISVFLPIYQVVEKVLDFADVVVMILQQKYDFGNVSLVQLDRTIAF